MAAGLVSHGNAPVLDPLRCVGGSQKVPGSTSFHVTMDSISACSGGLETSDRCRVTSYRNVHQVLHNHCGVVGGTLKRERRKKAGVSFEAERCSGLATADLSVRKSSL